MIASIQEYITSYLGPEFIDSPTFDIMSSYKVCGYDFRMSIESRVLDEMRQSARWYRLKRSRMQPFV